MMDGTGRYDNLHGDEDEIESELTANREAYEDAHADDWKYERD